MTPEHWIDNLSTTLARSSPRRGLLGRASALGLGLALDGAVRTASAKGKKKNKGNKNKPNKPKPRPSCSGGACAAEPEWAGRPRQIGHCEDICRECIAQDLGPLCFLDGAKPDGTPTKVARCCGRGETCCNGTCCPGSQTCCDGACVDKEENCGSCGNHCHGFEYCSGSGSAARCVCELPGSSRFQQCAPYGCVDTFNDPDHCGGCSNFNPNGLKCCQGNLCHYVNGVCCGGTCYPEGWPSCG